MDAANSVRASWGCSTDDVVAHSDGDVGAMLQIRTHWLDAAADDDCHAQTSLQLHMTDTQRAVSDEAVHSLTPVH